MACRWLSSANDVCCRGDLRMASLDYLIYHRLVAIEYAKTNHPGLLPFVFKKTKQHLVLRQHLADIDMLFNQHGIVYVVLVLKLY